MLLREVEPRTMHPVVKAGCLAVVSIFAAVVYAAGLFSLVVP